MTIFLVIAASAAAGLLTGGLIIRDKYRRQIASLENNLADAQKSLHFEQKSYSYASDERMRLRRELDALKAKAMIRVGSRWRKYNGEFAD